MKKDTKIAIVGGGIGGLTTALCLEYFGFKNYTVFEQAPEFKEIGAAISLWPNALRVYKAIGLLDEISSQWGELATAYIKNKDGKVLTKSSPNYELPTVCIHRAHLHSILANSISNEKLIPAHKLHSFTETGITINLQFENDE